MLTTDYQLTPRTETVTVAVKTAAAVLSGLNDAETAAFAVRLAVLLAAIWPHGYEDTLPDRIREEGVKVRA
jgi:hypothetical protein